jgi:ATP-dependent Clp protease ATP-binding subunit ClpC
LFDEIEKAHPDVFNMMLQILEDGYLTDAKGRRIDFTNTIVIMTSNVGAEKLQKEATLGFQAQRSSDLKDLDALHERNKTRVLDDLRKTMRPELLNRIDKTIVFRALTKKDIHRIIDLQIDNQVSPAAKQYLLDNGYDAKNGVRPLRRLIQDTFEDYLALGLLDDKLAKGNIVQVSTKKGELAYSVTAE